MLSCKGHLENLYDRLGQEYDKALGNSEEDSSEDWLKLNPDQGSDDGGQSNGGQSNDSNSKAAPWEMGVRHGSREPAVQPMNELAAQASVASAPEGPPEQSSPDNMLTGQPSGETEDKSPEATTPELDEWCRKCNLSRTELKNKCECGLAFLDRLNLEEEADVEEPASHKTAVMLNLAPMIQRDEFVGEDSDAEAYPLTIDPVSMRPEALPLNAAWKDESDPGWIRIRTVMDSGAAENVGPPSMAPTVPTLDSPGSLRGQAYIAAGHERIPNLGQQTLNVMTNEGYETQTVYQIAEVTRPLTAVGTTCDKGNIVVYGPHGGCIYNRETGIQTDFNRRGGIYELDLWMRTNQKGSGDQQQGFPWPGC